MVVYTCKKCGEPNYLTPHAFWNISDLGIKCKECGTINTITIENGGLKKTRIVSIESGIKITSYTESKC